MWISSGDTSEWLRSGSRGHLPRQALAIVPLEARPDAVESPGVAVAEQLAVLGKQLVDVIAHAETTAAQIPGAVAHVVGALVVAVEQAMQPGGAPAGGLATASTAMPIRAAESRVFMCESFLLPGRCHPPGILARSDGRL